MARDRQVARLQFVQASTQGKDNDALLREDIRQAFEKDADFVAFTELGTRKNYNLMKEVARNKGYRTYQGNDDCAIAINHNGVHGPNLRFKSGDYRKVHGGQNKPEHLGGRYGEKGITWVHAKFYGVDVWFHTAHWVHNQTDDVTGGNRRKAAMVSRAMCHWVRHHGRKGAVSFFSGDMNVDPEQPIYPHQMFRENKLITIWVDGGQKPTHGRRSIDVIGRYGSDKRVEFHRYVTHPGNSDHRQVSAWYDVQVDQYAAPDPNDPTNDPDGPIVTGGNISWVDYTDNEIYALPQAVDDTDTYNG